MGCAKNLSLGSILYSTENEASMNIIRHLQEDWNWRRQGDKLYDFSACGKKDCCTGLKAVGYDKEIIDIEPDFESNYYLYASTHRSEKNMPSLTAHFPGNWASADFGGEPRTLNMANATRLKQILKQIKEAATKRELGWTISMEVDHHGPTPQGGEKQLIFVEIGSSKKEWNDDTAGAIIAEAMMKSILRIPKEYPTYIALGGGHYAPKFTQFVLGEKTLDGQEIAISHICPKYKVDGLDEDMLKQAVEKTAEGVKGVLIDWKGLKKEQKDRLIPIIEDMGLEVIRV